MKLFASDFDGTLFNKEKLLGISDSSFDAIRKFQKEGNLFGICSGRAKDLKMFELSFKGKVQCDFYILMTGAVILDKNYHVLYEQYIDQQSAKALYERYAARGIMNIIAHDEMGKLHYFKPFSQRKFLEDTSYRISGFSLITLNKQRARGIAEEMNQQYGEYICAYQNGSIIDVVAAGCSKASGIQFVKELYQPDTTYGIGDSFNDIPLLKEVDGKFTFHNAPEEVKKYADIFVDTVSEAIKKTES